MGLAVGALAQLFLCVSPAGKHLGCCSSQLLQERPRGPAGPRGPRVWAHAQKRVAESWVQAAAVAPALASCFLGGGGQAVHACPPPTRNPDGKLIKITLGVLW